jgi:hypothetical protein
VTAFVAERLWPGATESAVRAAIEALRGTSERLAATGVPIRFLGGTFVLEDEALLCRFDGTAQAIRTVHELAGLTFDRLLPTVDVPQTTSSEEET